MNGIIDSLVNPISKGLGGAVVTYTRYTFTFEEWVTALTVVCYVVNSRPLFPEVDPLDFHGIMAKHIFHPYVHTTIPQGYIFYNDNTREFFKVVQQRIKIFWSTWIKDIHPLLLSRYT